MNDTPEERAIGRGDNNPPELLPILPLDASEERIAEELARQQEARGELSEELPYDEAKLAAFIARVSDFCDAAGAWQDIAPLTSEAQSKRLTDFVAQARSLFKELDDWRKDEKSYWDAKAALVQAVSTPLLAKIKAVGETLKGIQGQWLIAESNRLAAEKAEKERIAREALEQAKREAEAAVARNDISGQVDSELALKDAEKAAKAAAKPAKAQSSSATGAGRSMALRTVASARITNARQVFMHFQDNPRLMDVLQSLADAEIRAGRAVPGAEREEKQVAA
jgi:hypothetical protein